MVGVAQGVPLACQVNSCCRSEPGLGEGHTFTGMELGEQRTCPTARTFISVTPANADLYL